MLSEKEHALKQESELLLPTERPYQKIRDWVVSPRVLAILALLTINMAVLMINIMILPKHQACKPEQLLSYCKPSHVFLKHESY